MNISRRDDLWTARFGRFVLDSRRRELVADGVPVPIGSRAFDVFVVLVEARGQLVTKDELFSRVWPKTVVEENTLQFQISALRKGLGPDRDFIKTISGRGYRFVADISTPSYPGAGSIPQRRDALPSINPALATSDLIDREAIFTELTDFLAAHQLAAVAGGGKTRLGRELGRRLLSGFSDRMWISALGPSSAAELVFPTVATALGSADENPDAPEGLAVAAAPKRLLFLLSIDAQMRP
jgi:DNA-binding winged helix-turn-helix (wHTH) protein